MSWKFRSVILVTWAAFVGSPVQALTLAERSEKIRKLEAAVSQHNTDGRYLGSLGEEYVLKATDSRDAMDYETARKYLERGLTYLPHDAELRGWLALLTCLEARDLSGATAKSTALAGLDQLDLLVAENGDNLLIRFLRASVCMRIPRSWGRLDMALEDLSHIEFAVRRDPTLLKTYGLVATDIYMKLGRIQLVRGEKTEAKRFLTQAVEAGQDEHADVARKLLLKHFSRADASTR